MPVVPKASPANDAMSRAANARNAARITREQAAKMTDPGNKTQLAKAAEDFDRNASQFERGADFARSTTTSKKAGGSIKGMKKGGNVSTTKMGTVKTKPGNINGVAAKGLTKGKVVSMAGNRGMKRGGKA
jgi:hypothetical protein